MNHLLSLFECLAVIHGWIYCDAASTAKLQKLGSPGSQASGKSILGTALPCSFYKTKPCIRI